MYHSFCARHFAKTLAPSLDGAQARAELLKTPSRRKMRPSLPGFAAAPFPLHWSLPLNLLVGECRGAMFRGFYMNRAGPIHFSQQQRLVKSSQEFPQALLDRSTESEGAIFCKLTEQWQNKAAQTKCSSSTAARTRVVMQFCGALMAHISHGTRL